jgi:hypothetical protein
VTPHEFYDVLRAYCARFNASTSSYGRTMLHNDRVGGVPGSAHQFWLAADVIYDTPPPHAFRIEIGARLGLLVIDEGDHDHLQPLDWPKG